MLRAISDAEILLSEISTGFSFNELGLLIKVGNDLPVVLQDAAVIIPQWEALDSAAQADLVAFVQANCKFPSNLVVEAYVQKLLSAAVLLSSIYQLFK